MIVSYSQQFLFIHIYKVAGKSINQALEPYRHQISEENKLKSYLHRGLRKIGLHTNYPFQKYYPFSCHAKAAQVKERFPNQVFTNLFKFTFVRNPWDWQVSLYHFALQDPEHHQHELVKSMSGFEEYLDWRISEDLHLQKEFVTGDEGEILLHYIGRFEHLQDDFNEVCDRIGIPRKELPHVNQSKHRDYRNYYNKRTRKMVEDAFAQDIELFGYTFDEAPSKPMRLG